MVKSINSHARLSERREASRIAVRLGATAYVASSDRSVEGTVLDISETGARLELKGLDIIPARLMLYIPDVDCTYTCEVAWRNGSQCGLRFVNTETF